MHTLRHTFATRCIENGMKPKTLQTILGHSTIGMTMNLYVHVTDDEKTKEVQNIEKMLKIILNWYSKKYRNYEKYLFLRHSQGCI